MPYALRVRCKEDVRRPFAAAEFNRTTNADRSAEVSLDLGESAGEHNEIEVGTRGHRLPPATAQVEGSDDRKAWSTVLDKVHLLHFEEGGQVVDVRRFTYTPSRYRYLRMRVAPDPTAANDAPAIARCRCSTRSTRRAITSRGRRSSSRANRCRLPRGPARPGSSGWARTANWPRASR